MNPPSDPGPAPARMTAQDARAALLAGVPTHLVHEAVATTRMARDEDVQTLTVDEGVER